MRQASPSALRLSAWAYAHLLRVRRRATGDDWEVTLDPPLNVVLPVSRSGLAVLWGAFGED